MTDKYICSECGDYVIKLESDTNKVYEYCESCDEETKFVDSESSYWEEETGTSEF